ncbi:MAG: transporter substrate-binding domain-containing protein [Clostridiales bacterium]|jgi:polar amino acid transport system substrate-binding protein|nr:transporter substrate-binding domain-containing protein [Clostridiales bacterium]
MKKVLLITAIMVAALFVACGKKDNVLVVGVTQFEPMNFLDANGNWTGFDTEFALAVGERLGMEIQFQEITWSQKFIELQAGTIDAIWNGMTANTVDSATGRPRHEDVDFSYSYMLNTQCVVIRTDRVGEFTSAADLAGRTAAAEEGSAGDTVANEVIGADGSFIGVVAQIDTFIEVKSGAVDFAVVDSILAHQIAGTGDFGDLMVAELSLGARQEVYAIGLPIGSDLVEQINNAIMELYSDGTLRRIAEKYGLEESVVIGTQPISSMH